MSESIRERIARALVPHVEACPAFWCPGALGGCFECLALAVEAADALLAAFPILAGVTDEMVETGARGLTRHYFAEEGVYNPCEAKVTEHTVEPIRGIARAVLEAVYGKAEQ